MIFDEHDHDELSRLFDLTGYPGYKPEVREAPNGDTNVDAGPAGKRYLHVALKYDPPAWAIEYLARAHFEACRVAEALGVPDAYYPRVENGTLRVLEYPSAGHTWASFTHGRCRDCGVAYSEDLEGSEVCPALAAGAGTAEHTDMNLFTLNLWRSTPQDHEQSIRGPASITDTKGSVHKGDVYAWTRGAPTYHIGEIGELVGLGPATPHRVPARPYVQKSIVYFAIPDHAARLSDPRNTFTQEHGGIAYVPGSTVGAWLAERTARRRIQKGSY